VNGFIAFIAVKIQCGDIAHTSSYTGGLDCIILEKKLVVTWWTDVG
jgi:hypothetical protein